MTVEEGMHIALIERDFICRRDMAHLGINWALVEHPQYWLCNYWTNQRRWRTYPEDVTVDQIALRQMQREF